METKGNNMLGKNKRLIGILLAIVIILMVPLLSMQFNIGFPDPGQEGVNEFNWDAFDFAVMGTLLVTMGLIFEIAARNVKTIEQRVVIGMVVLTALFLIWVELAVGIFGSPFAGS